jgi:hypothetical protein
METSLPGNHCSQTGQMLFRPNRTEDVCGRITQPPTGGYPDFWAVKMKFLYADGIRMALAILLIM